MNLHRLFFTFVSIIERALRLFGREVYTQLDDSGLGFFAFHREVHPAGDREYWGLGLHVIVSPLRVHPQV